MASEREIFNRSGPVCITTVDWKNPYHRRSVAASLVQGVYILERDRQQNRLGPRAFAPPWWDFFHFQLIRVLVDDADRSVFGAVYEFKFPPSYNYVGPKPPRYVVAFRGTIIRPDTLSEDAKSSLYFIKNTLRRRLRFQLAMQTVQDMVAIAGAANTWLAGHSMGSAIALVAGKNMVKMGCLIETYLFNPLFPSPRIEHMIRSISSVFEAVIAVNDQRDSFAELSRWTPYLFVNPFDLICAEYIGYFEHREKMVESAHLMVESAHLLPSAYLIINRSPSQGLRNAHGISQWWEPNINCQIKRYLFSRHEGGVGGNVYGSSQGGGRSQSLHGVYFTEEQRFTHATQGSSSGYQPYDYGSKYDSQVSSHGHGLSEDYQRHMAEYDFWVYMSWANYY